MPARPRSCLRAGLHRTTSSLPVGHQHPVGHAVDHGEQPALLHGQVVKVPGLLFLELAGPDLQLLLVQGSSDHQGEVVDAEGLGDEVVSPFFHALHRVGHGPQAGHDDDGNLRMGRPGLLQDFQGAHHRHLQIAEDHVHRLRRPTLPGPACRWPRWAPGSLRGLSTREQPSPGTSSSSTTKIVYRSVITHLFASASR